MSNKIDQRIVEMSFENQKFEKGIQESKNSLQDFSKALKNMGNDSGFSGLESSVGGISKSFSVLQEVGIGALRRIGEVAVDVGTSIVKSLAIDPITQGFNEMELKMNSTQTIMASTGESLEVVNRYLQELNEYSDKTIYSFSDMTSNIGKFTNAGVKLEMAVASIQGISNAAALAGANAEEASRAMYNFAQALSAGYVKLIDWKSIENANMATVEFKNQLLESAVAAGTLTKTADGMYKVLTTNGAGKKMETTISATKNFNDSLAYQWMVTDALTNTLADYADETTEIGKRAMEAATQVTTFSKLMDTLKESVGSGWAQTFELIFGDFNEGKKLWTGINDIMGAMIERTSDARNALAAGGLSSGWKQFTNQGIFDLTTFEQTLTQVAAKAGYDLTKILESGKTLEESLRLDVKSINAHFKETGEVLETTADQAWLTGDMLTEAVDQMAKSVKNLSEEELANAGYTEKAKQELFDLAEALKAGTVSADEFAKKMFSLSGRENIIQGLKDAAIALLTVLRPISQAFDEIFPPLTAERLYQATESFKAMAKAILISEGTANKIKRTFAGLFAVVDIGYQVVKLLANAFFEVVKAVLPVGDGLLGASASLGDFLVGLNRAIKASGVFQYALLAVKIVITIVRALVLDLASGVLEFVAGLWNAADPLDYLQKAALKVFGGIVDVVKMAVNWISGKLTSAFQKAGELLNSDFGGKATGVLGTVFQLIKDITQLVTGKAATGLKSLGEILANLDFNKIATFVAGGTILLLIFQLSRLTQSVSRFMDAGTKLTKMLSRKFFSSSPQIKEIAFAIGVLAGSIWLLSTIPAYELKASLNTLTKALAEFVAAYFAVMAINVIASKVMKSQDMVKSAFGLTSISAGLLAMSVALKVISTIDEGKIMECVGALTAMLVLIAAYQALDALIRTIPGQGMISANLFNMSIGVLGLIAAIAILKTITQTDISTGISKIASILMLVMAVELLFGIAARIGGGNKLSASILSMAAGILAMVGVMKILSIVDRSTITSGIANLALMVGILAAIQLVFGIAARVGGGEKVQTHMLSIALGLAAMLVVIAILGTMEQSVIDSGIFAIAKMVGIIGAIEVLTALAARLGGANKVQKILAAVAITLLAFTVVIKVLEHTDQGAIDNGILVLTKMVGLIAAVEVITALTSRLGTVMDKDGKVIKGISKNFSTLIGVVVAILAVTAALILLSMVPQEDLRTASESLALVVTTVTVMAASLAVLSKVLGSLSTESKGMLDKLKTLGSNFLILIAVIGVTTLVFAALQSLRPMLENVSWESMGKFATGLTVILALIVGFNTLLKGQGSANWDGLLSLVPGFVAMAAVVLATMGFFAALKAVLPWVQETDWGSIAKFAAGIGIVSTLIIAFDALMRKQESADWATGLMSLIPAFVAAAAVVLATMGFFAALKAVLPIVKEVEWGDIGKFATGIAVVGVLMGAMAALAPVFSAMGNPATILTTLLGVVVAIVAVAAVVLAVVGLAVLLDKMIANKDTLTRGLDLLVEVGSGIGRFVGAIVGGFAMETLVGIGEGLVGFVNALSEVDTSNLEGIKDIAAAILMITGAAVLDGVSRFLLLGDNPMDVFGEQIGGLVLALKKISPVDAMKASAVMVALKPMAEALKDVANAAKDIPNSGGFLGEFVGENDIDKFAVMLQGFIAALNAAGINTDTVGHANAVLAAMTLMTEDLKSLANAAKNIPNSGGFLGDFFGENDINTFGQMLADFVAVFSPLSVEDDIEPANKALEAMTPLADYLKDFAEAAATIPNTGGMIVDFVGDNDLGVFATTVQGLVETFGGLDLKKIGIASTALTAMNLGMLPALTAFSNLANGLKNSGGIQQFFEGNTTLKEFAKDLAKFVDELAGVDFSVVTPALASLAEITISFETVGASVMENASKSFENNKEPFQKLISSILDEPITAVKKKKKELVDEIKDIFESVTDDSKSYVQKFKTLGADLVTGLQKGIESKQSSAITAITNVLSSIVTAAKKVVDSNSPSEVFKTIGAWCTQGLALGLTKETPAAVGAGIKMANATEEGIRDALGVHSISDIFAKIGSYIPLSIGDGIESIKSWITEKASSLGLDISSFTIEGVVDGLTGGDGIVTEGIQSLLDALQGNAGIEDAAEGVGTGIGGSVTSGLQDSLSDSTDGIGGSKTKETIKSELEKLQDYIENEKFYGRLSLEEELALYDNLRDTYKEGSDERKQIDREIYTLTKTIYEAQMSYIEDVTEAQQDAAKERLDLERDYLKEVSDAQEAAAEKLQDLQEDYENNVYEAKKAANKKLADADKDYYEDQADILEKAAKEREDLQKDYAADQLAINKKLLSDIEAQNKAYEDAVKSRADAIYSSYGIFDAVDEDAEVSGDELLQNLRDQGAALSEWKQALDALAARGVGTALIEELQELGPSSKAQIKALLTLTEEQLTEYVSLFEGKYSFARMKAETELEGLKESTFQAIADLNAQAAIDLDTLAATFATNMAAINANAASEMEELKTTYTLKVSEINAELEEKLYELKDKFDEATSDVNVDLEEKLEEMEEKYNESLTKINEELDAKLKELKETFSTTMKDVDSLTEQQFRDLIAANKATLTQMATDSGASLATIEQQFDSSGNAIVTGFNTDMQTLQSQTESSLNTMTNAATNTLQDAVGDFHSAGLNAAYGFASGIREGVYGVINAARYIAYQAVAAAENVLDENSPSKVFMGIGRFVSVGFAAGITDYADQAAQAGEDLANGPIAFVSKALSMLEDEMSGDLDWEPVISPVLDLSNVDANAVTNKLGAGIYRLGTTSARLANEVAQSNPQGATTNTTSIVNKFDLSNLTVRNESDIDAIAAKLYQKQQSALRGRGMRTVPSY